jgi:hypothetical protein
MKYSQWIGIVATIVLCIACFFPWTYHPDLNKYFTGFFSEQNMYGRPGKLILILGAMAITFFALPKVWAKRVNWLICAILVAYAIKTYIRFTSCYVGFCPVKQTAMYIVLIAPMIMLVMAFVPKLEQSEK